MAVKVREDVPLEELLLAVEGELLGADGAHLPVALHVLLEAALLKVWREDHLAQRAALVDVTPGREYKFEGVGNQVRHILCQEILSSEITVLLKLFKFNDAATS